MTKPPTIAERLTRREREIMNALFCTGQSRLRGGHPRTHLEPSRRLGRPRHANQTRKEGLPETSAGWSPVYLLGHDLPAAAKRAALRQYLQTFFGGSLKQMMTALVNEADWTDEELDALRDEIDRVRKERKEQLWHLPSANSCWQWAARCRPPLLPRRPSSLGSASWERGLLEGVVRRCGM
jgi:hypothetical protein